MERTQIIPEYYVTMNSNDSIVLVIYDIFFNPVASYLKKSARKVKRKLKERGILVFSTSSKYFDCE